MRPGGHGGHMGGPGGPMGGHHRPEGHMRGPGGHMGGPMGGHRMPPPPPPPHYGGYRPRRHYGPGCFGCLSTFLLGFGSIIALGALLVSIII